MHAYLIDPESRCVTVQEYDGQPHSLYTLFGSLLVDTNEVLNEHMVYTAGEAFEKGGKPYFLGEKLLFGKALVTGYAGFEDLDAAIKKEELESLLLYDVPAFYEKILSQLPADFDFARKYALDANDMHEKVTPEWVFYVFNMADEATKNYFLNHLEETVTKGENLHGYFEKMANIAVRSMK